MLEFNNLSFTLTILRDTFIYLQNGNNWNSISSEWYTIVVVNSIVGGVIFPGRDSVVLHQRYSVMAIFYGRSYASASDDCLYLDVTILYCMYIFFDAEKSASRYNGAISGTCSSKKLFCQEEVGQVSSSSWSEVFFRSILRIAKCKLKHHAVNKYSYLNA